MRSIESDWDDNSDSNNANDSDHKILSAIDKIRFQKQKPTFQRIFEKFKKRDLNCLLADQMLECRDAIRSAVDRSVIKEVEDKDHNDVSYLPFDYVVKRGPTSQSSSSSQTVNISKDKPPKKRRKLCSDGNTSRRNCSIDSSNYSIESDFDTYKPKEKTKTDGSVMSTSSSFFADNEMDSSSVASASVSQSTPSSSASLNLPKKSVDLSMKMQPKSAKRSLSAEEREVQMSRYDFADWVSETLPQQSPFIGQTGDRVVYLRDAHLEYMAEELEPLKAHYERFKCSYKQITADIKSDDYIIYAKIADIKFYQIDFIQFSVIYLESVSLEKPFQFTVLYRPNRKVNDFLVLEKMYLNPENNVWTTGSKFKSLIRTKRITWWMGAIKRRSAFKHRYPDSLYKCFEVVWNNGDKGRLSPWEMFEVEPSLTGKLNGIRVSPQDFLALNYKPSVTEWPEVENIEFNLWRCYECKRIYSGIKFLEERVHKGLFNLFKDLRQREEIAYPITIKSIKDRLKNMFYRRKSAVVSDIKLLRINARLGLKKNELQFCDDFIELLLNIINDCKAISGNQFAPYIKKYHHIFESNIHTDSHVSGIFKEHSYDKPIPSSLTTPEVRPKTNPSNNKSQTVSKSSAQSSNTIKKRRKRTASESQVTAKKVEITESQTWKTDSLKFIDDLFRVEEFQPFREAVDNNVYPLYLTVISNPMDLSLIQHKLTTDAYVNPKEVREDFRLICDNSKLFNKNAKSAIRQITKRLSTKCEDRMREIIVDWERVLHYEHKQKERPGYGVREPTSRNQLWGYGAQQYY
ncbi:unnamed protein product [Medioppia subpectinata]|uniref:Bromo domain-containing protein n=1 Tax=Medioppia subpectinata TaxID=1979941 RepID=A0A7R9Q1P2_9ACAR|nr:unnamed protein product [Medioppia subpectinata]CAG2109443.1 unnamed protein product [Medioppia subpectinata]